VLVVTNCMSEVFFTNLSHIARGIVVLLHSKGIFVKPEVVQ
jgi:hypothetical protein